MRKIVEVLRLHLKLNLSLRQSATLSKISLAISMELFIKILEQLVQAQEIVKRNKDLEQIILMLRVYTKKQLGFICES